MFPVFSSLRSLLLEPMTKPFAQEGGAICNRRRMAKKEEHQAVGVKEIVDERIKDGSTPSS